MIMLIGMKVYSSSPERIEKVITWSSGAPSAKISAIGTRNTIDRYGVRYFGCTALNHDGR